MTGFHSIKCKSCGKGHRAMKRNAKYCSDGCRQAAYRGRGTTLPAAVTVRPGKPQKQPASGDQFSPRRSAKQQVPAGWLGAKKGDYRGELGMYAWPA